MNDKQIISFNGVRQTTEKVRVPKQTTRIGKAGYIGDVEVYEPKAPQVRLVPVEGVVSEPPVPAGDEDAKPVYDDIEVDIPKAKPTAKKTK